jgi:amino-acid N-acetyltransferase
LVERPPAGIRLRPATALDAGRIRSLILRVRINPTQLDWRRFVVAVDPADRLIGCGQVKPHSDGSRELASIAVRPAWRLRQVASAIVADLQQRHAPPLWLTCRPRLAGFYKRFGFQIVEQPEAMPRYFQKIVRLARLGDWLGSGERLAVMQWEG